MLSIFKKKNRTSFKSASSSAYSSPPNAQYAPLAKKYTMYDSMATLVTILSAGNGLISLVNGIQWFAAGGSYIPHLDAVEVLVGAIMLMVSFSMMMVLFTKLRHSKAVTLPAGIIFGITVSAAMIGLAVFFGLGNKNPSTTQAIQTACNQAITSTPFVDVTVQQLQQACVEDEQAYLSRSVTWTAIRAAFQTIGGILVIGWAIRKLIQKNQGGRQNVPYDQNIPFTNYAAPMGQDGQSQTQQSQGKLDMEANQFVLRSPPYYAGPTGEPYHYYPPPNGAGYQS